MKGILIHVGDDLNPSVIDTENRAEYELHLLPGHADPDWKNLTYGDWTHRTRQFRALEQGDTAFFSFKFLDSEGTSWLIPAYFYLEAVLTGHEVLKLKDDPRIQCNAHVQRGDLNDPEALDDFRLLIGDQSTSCGHLHTPVAIDEKLWEALDLKDVHGTCFNEIKRTRKHRDGSPFSVQQINGSYLRAPKPLTEAQTHALTKTVEKTRYP